MTVRRLPLLQEPLLVRTSALGALNISLSSSTFLPPSHVSPLRLSPYSLCMDVKHLHKATQRRGQEPERRDQKRLQTGAKSCRPSGTSIALQSLTHIITQRLVLGFSEKIKLWNITVPRGVWSDFVFYYCFWRLKNKIKVIPNEIKHDILSRSLTYCNF